VRPNGGDTALSDESSGKTCVTKSFKFQAINDLSNTVISKYTVPGTPSTKIAWGYNCEAQLF